MPNQLSGRQLRRMLGILAASSIVVAVSGHIPDLQRYRHLSGLIDSLANKLTDVGPTPVTCQFGANRPYVVLALGQSNAGNHGASEPSTPTITTFAGQGCYLASDPLPGSTGSGGSIWPLLPDAWRAFFPDRHMIVASIGLDATQAADWVNWTSPVRRHLVSQLRAMRRAGIPPDVVFWQQGEADARAKTPPAIYSKYLTDLSNILQAEGYTGPVLLAQSTLCRQPPSAPLRNAIATLMQQFPERFQPGADTDSLNGDFWRVDGCHFNRRGLKDAARLWALALANWQRRATKIAAPQDDVSVAHRGGIAITAYAPKPTEGHGGLVNVGSDV